MTQKPPYIFCVGVSSPTATSTALESGMRRGVSLSASAINKNSPPLGAVFKLNSPAGTMAHGFVTELMPIAVKGVPVQKPVL